MFELVLTREAQRIYAAADRPLARASSPTASKLERDPRRGNNIKPLQGKYSGAYRYRVGDSRVVYTIDEAVVTVTVLTIAHRREVYN
jgi:mRNA interferase RelE/StbE